MSWVYYGMTEIGPRIQQLASRTHVCSGSQCWVLRAHNAQPGLLQLIMCGVQNCLPSVHLLFSLMPNLITYPWFHRQRNFLVCFFGSMPNSVTRWHPLLFPSILQSTAPGSRLHIYWAQVWEWCFIFQRFTTLLLAHLNWTHWSYKNSSWWVWIIKHWSKQLYIDQYYPYSDLVVSLLGRTLYAGSHFYFLISSWWMW